jgi:hypothetical protein
LILFDFWCFNATFSNISAISWRPVFVVEEAGVPGETHRPWASQINQPAKKLYIYRIVLNDRDSDNMSLVPCNFDSEYREDELTVWILSQHFIARSDVTSIVNNAAEV